MYLPGFKSSGRAALSIFNLQFTLRVHSSAHQRFTNTHLRYSMARSSFQSTRPVTSSHSTSASRFDRDPAAPTITATITPHAPSYRSEADAGRGTLQSSSPSWNTGDDRFFWHGLNFTIPGDCNTSVKGLYVILFSLTNKASCSLVVQGHGVVLGYRRASPRETTQSNLNFGPK